MKSHNISALITSHNELDPFNTPSCTHPRATKRVTNSISYFQTTMSSSRSNARLIRFAVFALVLIFCGFILTKGSSYPPLEGQTASVVPTTGNAQDPKVVAANGENKPVGGDKQANAAGGAAGNVGQKPGDKVAAPDTGKGVEGAKDAAAGAAAGAAGGAVAASGEKVSAVFVSLARNSDIGSMTHSIRQIEDRFNKNFHYDWVFLNDEPFNDEFKTAVSSLVSGKASFGTIPKEHWSYPDWIDQEKAALAREELVQKKVIYGGSVSYRHMCRFESGFFYKHELLQQYEYYWRVEPDIKIYCDIDYDVFKFMKDNDKMYGFTISLPEYRETIPTLWDTTKKFIEENPKYVDPNNNMAWISDDNGATYNGCHFWSNFEVGAFKLWRLEAYTKYFEYLDKAGGFFYERWGDAPVHSIAASLFIPKDKIHFFGDVGYFHVPFHNCPVDEETRKAKRCMCQPNEDFTWRGYSCTPKFFTQHGLKRPKGWENFT